MARQAAAAGVKRFVFLSSIKVNGEATGDTPFTSADAPAPVDPYAVSKLEAEQGLREIARKTGLEVVIIRPPLVYGLGAGGNFARLRRLAATGWPLPLGGIRNKRSLIGIDNLCDCIKVCLHHSDAAGRTFLVSDNHDVSTPDLVRLLASAVGRTAYLPAIPVGMLQMAAKFCGRGPEMKRLTENLQLDCSDTLRLLNRQPAVSLEEGIRRSVK
jgi:nucleoside-diphosphate-sugar epimerase